MSRLDPDKLRVDFLQGVEQISFDIPRRYTLTHSDFSGELYLSVGPEYNKKQFSGLYSKFMRDEILAEWRKDKGELSLHVYSHVSGGLVLGSASWRGAIIRKEMPLVLEIIRFGDRRLFRKNPLLDKVPIIVHFKSSKQKYNKVENWGTPRDYII